MTNVCVSCGTQIPDECGSMICKQCDSNEPQQDLIDALTETPDSIGRQTSANKCVELAFEIREEI